MDRKAERKGGAEMTENIHLDGDDITQALEDARGRYTEPGESQTEKSKRAVLEEIRAMIREHPEMSNKEIALEVGSTPKQVENQRYQMGKKDKAPNPREAGYENPRKKAAEDAAEKAEKERMAELPALQAVVQRVAHIGKVAQYVVEDGDVEIEIRNDGLDSTFPVEKLGEMIAELTALKLILEKGTFAKL